MEKYLTQQICVLLVGKPSYIRKAKVPMSLFEILGPLSRCLCNYAIAVSITLLIRSKTSSMVPNPSIAAYLFCFE